MKTYRIENGITEKKLTSDEIINSIERFHYPEQMIEDLHEMILAFYRFDQDTPEDMKSSIIQTYITLRHALQQIVILKGCKHEVVTY